nr:MAG TPA: hypothetical protein [Caudoviricetes sp.]
MTNRNQWAILVSWLRNSQPIQPKGGGQNARDGL